MGKRVQCFRWHGQLFRASYIASEKRQVVKVLDKNYQNEFAKKRVDHWKKVLEIEGLDKPNSPVTLIDYMENMEKSL